MKQIFSKRRVLLLVCFIAVTLFGGLLLAGDFSNKWRIKVNHEAKSDGTIMFRVNPKDQTAHNMTVDIKTAAMKTGLQSR